MSEETTKNITALILILAFLGMMIFIALRARQNREEMIKDHAPKVAGEDELEGVQDILSDSMSRMKKP